jgi:hypothetical protein
LRLHRIRGDQLDETWQGCYPPRLRLTTQVIIMVNTIGATANQTDNHPKCQE